MSPLLTILFCVVCAESTRGDLPCPSSGTSLHALCCCPWNPTALVLLVAVLHRARLVSFHLRVTHWPFPTDIRWPCLRAIVSSAIWSGANLVLATPSWLGSEFPVKGWGDGSVRRSVCYTNVKVCVQILNHHIQSWLSCIHVCL